MQRGFVIFLQWPTFWDFYDTRLLNKIPSGIRICFPLLWRIFFQLGSIPITCEVLITISAKMQCNVTFGLLLDLECSFAVVYEQSSEVCK